MKGSLERYLLRWLLGTLGLGALVVVLAAYLATLDEMNEVYDADLKNVAEALGSYLRVGDASLQPAGRPPAVRTDVPDDAEIVTLTWTPSGQRVYSSDPRVAVPFLSHESLSHQTIGGEEWIVYTDVSDNGVAQAAQRAGGRRETAAEAAATTLAPVVALVLGVAAMLVFALRRGLKPLDTATHDLAARTELTLEPMPVDRMPREMSPLVHAVNALMARLAAALAGQRRFVADAAHELRSPITALRLQLQLLDRAGDERSRQAAMRELQAGVERSQRLVEQLLQVARSEPDSTAFEPTPVDLGELARSVVAGLAAKAQQRDIDLGAATREGLSVQGDREQLVVLLNNLVENALRYTPAAGAVDVQAFEREGRPALAVVDEGPGIPPAERERVFDRFYRGPQPPAVDVHDTVGSGLGLAIVRAIAARHGASVSLHDAEGGFGLRVEVVFSAAAAAAEPQPAEGPATASRPLRPGTVA